MSNPWFRVYSEFSHDPKVQMLSEAMQRRYIMLMCLCCSNNLVTLHENEIAFHLRISDDDLAETKAIFVAKGFIDAGWNLLNWEKRQFASDKSNARVAKHRALLKEKQKNARNSDVTLQKRNSNALDTDTDTDTDKKGGEREPSPDGSPPPLLPEYLEFIKTERPELVPEVVFANFVDHFPVEKQTLAQWKKWVRREFAGPQSVGPPSTADPESRASIEALGLSLGIGRWDELKEHWTSYKNRVKGVPA